jgi:hypothetical protein
LTIIVTFANLKDFPLLKRLVTYIIVSLVSFAYGYEAIDLLSKAHDADFFCGETSSESEEPTEKKENLKFTDDEDFNNKRLHNRSISDPIELSRMASGQRTNFSSSDYSHEVYSPPEVL